MSVCVMQRVFSNEDSRRNGTAGCCAPYFLLKEVIGQFYTDRGTIRTASPKDLEPFGSARVPAVHSASTYRPMPRGSRRPPEPHRANLAAQQLGDVLQPLCRRRFPAAGLRARNGRRCRPEMTSRFSRGIFSRVEPVRTPLCRQIHVGRGLSSTRVRPLCFICHVAVAGV